MFHGVLVVARLIFQSRVLERVACYSKTETLKTAGEAESLRKDTQKRSCGVGSSKLMRYLI